MNIKVKKLSEDVEVPFRATSGSAGADIYAYVKTDVLLKPGERVLIPTGLMLEIPENYGGFVFPRSSLASKHGISLSNCVGVIDSDYRGELKVAVINHSADNFVIKNGDRIAQLVILPVCGAKFITEENLSETGRGQGGFGSTGKN
ncbi:MAG: dUTP diphosphatase [Oscillospiraceae bacterium]|nr:dUTP diphosphatase [Oscillospiraceae bacterium]